MKNQSPIFLNCFSRGGSNILWNIFLTHPDVCSPIAETIELFRLDRKGISRAGFKAAWLTQQRRFFNQWWLEERKPISRPAQAFIDQHLYEWKLKTLEDAEMCYKREGEPYQPSEVEAARLVAKNNNGLAFLTDHLLEIYPDATFFALVRDPLALYESHKRRGISNSVHQFADFYNRIAQRMIADAERYDCYTLVRFEDLLANPIDCMKHLYEFAGLDFDKIRKVRLKAKAHLQPDGRHDTEFQVGHHYWFALEDVYQILDPNINRRQRRQLSNSETEKLRHLLKPTLSQLGYA